MKKLFLDRNSTISVQGHCQFDICQRSAPVKKVYILYGIVVLNLCVTQPLQALLT